MKIDKDTYFMNLATLVASRSIDPNTKHGCVAITQDGSILSTGYNGPPRGVNDSSIPLTRPQKYIFMEHSERNCIYNAARIGVPLKGCIFYVTGIPCRECFRAMFQVGASKVIYNGRISACLGEEDKIFFDFISNYIQLEEFVDADGDRYGRGIS
jgi:dCMP deaminase